MVRWLFSTNAFSRFMASLSLIFLPLNKLLNNIFITKGFFTKIFTSCSNYKRALSNFSEGGATYNFNHKYLYGFTFMVDSSEWLSIFIYILIFLMGYGMTSYILDGYIYSKNIIIRLVQKFCFIIYNLFIIIGFLFMLYLMIKSNHNYCSDFEDIIKSGENVISEEGNNFSNNIDNNKNMINVKADDEYYDIRISKKAVEAGINKGGELLINAINELTPNILPAMAAGSAARAAGEVVKNVSMPLAGKLASIAGSAALTAGAVRASVNVVDSVLKNDEILGSSFNPDDKTPPSPDKEFIINSINEMDINIYLQNKFNSWFVNCDGININLGEKSPIEFILGHLLELDLIILVIIFYCILISL